jgi:hypothetical protein
MMCPISPTACAIVESIQLLSDVIFEPLPKRGQSFAFKEPGHGLEREIVDTVVGFYGAPGVRHVTTIGVVPVV